MIEAHIDGGGELDRLESLRDDFDFEVDGDRLKIPLFSEAVALRNIVIGASLAESLSRAIRRQAIAQSASDLHIGIDRARIKGY